MVLSNIYNLVLSDFNLVTKEIWNNLRPFDNMEDKLFNFKNNGMGDIR